MAKKYRTLKQQFHASNKDEAVRLYHARFHSESAITWDFKVAEHQLFCLVTPAIARSIERIMNQEMENFALWGRLPQVARRLWSENLIMAEIVATNDIEGVRSTRKEIGELITAIESEKSPRSRRFLEMVRLYLKIADETLSLPTSAKELRTVYDTLLDGEITKDNRLDGELFRNGPVYIFDGSNKIVHHGVQPESAIIDALAVMFSVLEDHNIPRLIAIIVAHFMLEYIHPFYDGNGRVGRFMLAQNLAQLLSIPTVLSVSQVINKKKNNYYKAFMTVEEPYNYADITPFVIDLLDIIETAQDTVAKQLQDYDKNMTQLAERLEQLHQNTPKEKPKHIVDILFILGQESLFGSAGGVVLKTLAKATAKSEQQTRRYLGTLEDYGLVDATTTRPKRYRLSQAGRKYLGLE